MIPGGEHNRAMRAAIAAMALASLLFVSFAAAADYHIGKDDSCTLCHLRLCCPVMTTEVPQLPQPDQVSDRIRLECAAEPDQVYLQSSRSRGPPLSLPEHV